MTQLAAAPRGRRLDLDQVLGLRTDSPLVLEAARRCTVVLWVFVYVGALMWSVATLIAPIFGYQGYVPRQPTLLELALVVAGTVVVALTLAPRGVLPSDVARLFLVLTTGIPVMWVPVFYGPLRSEQVENLVLAVTGCFVVIAACLHGRGRRLVLLRVSRTTFWILIGGFALVGVAYLLSSGIGLRVTGFSDVYAQRAEYGRHVTALGSYLVGWLAGGTFPVLMAVGLHRRRLVLVAAGLLGVFLLYALTGFKSYAFAVAILVGTSVMTRRGVTRASTWTALLAVLIGVVGVLDGLRHTYVLTSFVVRRAISTAGINTAYYVDLLDGGPYYLLRHSVLSFLGPAPYGQPPALLVGAHYYDATTAANANFLADGFANAGWAGMLVAALVVGLLLRLYDKVAAGLPLRVSAPALVFILLALANTAVLTVVATHGAAVLIGWISVLPAQVALTRRRARASGGDVAQDDGSSTARA